MTEPGKLPEGAKPPLVENRDIVVPGQMLCTGLDYLPSNGTFRRDDAIVASVLGIVRFNGRLVSIIPLSGRYLPMEGDVIVGRVIDILLSGWRLDINSAWSAVLSITNTSGYIRKGEDLTKYYRLGEYMTTKIIQVTSQNLIDVTMKAGGMRSLKGGRVITVSANKVPRIIGKAGSMIEQVKSMTKCDIVVGQNGMVWLQGHPKNEIIAVEVLQKIEREAHTAGLTKRITEYLQSRMGEIKTAAPKPEVKAAEKPETKAKEKPAEKPVEPVAEAKEAKAPEAAEPKVPVPKKKKEEKPVKKKAKEEKPKAEKPKKPSIDDALEKAAPEQKGGD